MTTENEDVKDPNGTHELPVVDQADGGGSQEAAEQPAEGEKPADE